MTSLWALGVVEELDACRYYADEEWHQRRSHVSLKTLVRILGDRWCDLRGKKHS